jgi:hypothetical protein
MRTKLILGLTATLAAAVQSSNAQAVNSGLANDMFIANTIVAMDAAAPVVTETPIALFGDSLTAGTTAIDASVGDVLSRDTSSADAASMATAWNYSDFNAPQSLAAANVQSSHTATTVVDPTKRVAKTDYSGATADWLNLDGVSSMGMPAISQGSVAPTVDTGSEFAQNVAMDNNSDYVLNGGPQKASATSKGRSPMPMLASPEPGTVSLLIMGGAAVVGAIRRRK